MTTNQAIEVVDRVLAFVGLYSDEKLYEDVGDLYVFLEGLENVWCDPNSVSA